MEECTESVRRGLERSAQSLDSLGENVRDLSVALGKHSWSSDVVLVHLKQVLRQIQCCGPLSRNALSDLRDSLSSWADLWNTTSHSEKARESKELIAQWLRKPHLTTFMPVRSLNFTHSSIAPKFKHGMHSGRTREELVTRIEHGEESPYSSDWILDVVSFADKHWSLNNRHLWVLVRVNDLREARGEAELQARVRIWPLTNQVQIVNGSHSTGVIKKLSKSLSTNDGGYSILARGKCATHTYDGSRTPDARERSLISEHSVSPCLMSDILRNPLAAEATHGAETPTYMLGSSPHEFLMPADSNNLQQAQPSGGFTDFGQVPSFPPAARAGAGAGGETPIPNACQSPCYMPAGPSVIAQDASQLRCNHGHPDDHRTLDRPYQQRARISISGFNLPFLNAEYEERPDVLVMGNMTLWSVRPHTQIFIYRNNDQWCFCGSEEYSKVNAGECLYWAAAFPNPWRWKQYLSERGRKAWFRAFPSYQILSGDLAENTKQLLSLCAPAVVHRYTIDDSDSDGAELVESSGSICCPKVANISEPQREASHEASENQQAQDVVLLSNPEVQSDNDVTSNVPLLDDRDHTGSANQSLALQPASSALVVARSNAGRSRSRGPRLEKCVRQYYTPSDLAKLIPGEGSIQGIEIRSPGAPNLSEMDAVKMRSADSPLRYYAVYEARVVSESTVFLEGALEKLPEEFKSDNKTRRVGPRSSPDAGDALKVVLSWLWGKHEFLTGEQRPPNVKELLLHRKP